MDVSVGSFVSVLLPSGASSKGMVRRVIGRRDGGLVVELVNGSVGRVTSVAPKRAKLTPVRVLKSKPVLLVPREAVLDGLLAGESSSVEFKRSALWSQSYSKQDIDASRSPEVKKFGVKASKIVLAKVIAGFLNSGGGSLLIGVDEDKSGGENVLVGVEAEFSLLKNKDASEDGYRRMLLDDVIKPFFPESIFHHVNKYLSISFPVKDGKKLCLVRVKRSDHEVFLTVNGRDHFFIRVDTQTRELFGKQMVDYIKKSF